MGLDQHLRKPNGQSRESSNMGNTKHRTKHRKHNTIQKTKKISSTDSTKTKTLL